MCTRMSMVDGVAGIPAAWLSLMRYGVDGNIRSTLLSWVGETASIAGIKVQSGEAVYGFTKSNLNS